MDAVTAWAQAKHLPAWAAQAAGMRDALGAVRLDGVDAAGEVVGWQQAMPSAWRPRTSVGARGMVAFPPLHLGGGRALVVEGMSDRVAAHLVVDADVDVWGAVGASQVPAAVRLAAAAADVVTVVVDGDAAGWRAAGRVLLQRGSLDAVLSVRVAPDGWDLRDLVRAQASAVAEQLAPRRRGLLRPLCAPVMSPRATDTICQVMLAEPDRPSGMRHDGQRPSQGELVRVLEAHGARGRLRGGEWSGSCPVIDGAGCGAGEDRLHVTGSGLLGCRQCADGGRALWAAAAAEVTASGGSAGGLC